jgi:hypothetical protein
MPTLPPSIWWILGLNRSLRLNLETAYSLGQANYVSNLENIVGYLRTNKCTGLRSKVKNIPDIPKFLDFAAELEFAERFIKKGGKVRVLRDAYLYPLKSPDILVIHKVGSSYIEVKRMRDDVAFDELRRQLRAALRPYAVTVRARLGNYMSRPTVTGRGKTLKEQRIRGAVAKLATRLLPRSQVPFTFQKGGIEFAVDPIARPPGFVTSISSDAMVVPTTRIIRALVDDLKDKAVKRIGWTGLHARRYYVIALYCEYAQLDNDDAQEALLGHRARVMPGVQLPKVRRYSRVERADKQGWHSYLKSQALIPSNRTFLVRRGKYLTLPILNNVSGVLLHLTWGSTFSFIPNPFCSPVINSPLLKKIC